jgi:NDP-sugar pyrophosphorylase family protein
MLRHALVLTAGLGTRLQPLTSVRAKPAIPVAGEPLIRRIITWLSGQGVTELVLNLHHLPHTLTAVVGDGSDLGVHVRYSWEQPVVLGSAGGPRHALPMMDSTVENDAFFLVNGDTMTDLDLRALAAAHDASGALVTLAVVPNREPHKYGGVLTAGDGAVTGFARPGADAEGSAHFIGVQIAHADAFRTLQDGQAVNSTGDAYLRLLASRPGCIRAYSCDAAFQDIGTTSDYWSTSFACLGDRPPGQAYGQRVRIGHGARIARSILWDDVEIGDEAAIEECIVTDRVHVPAGSVYRRSVLRRGERGLVVTPL